MTDEGSSEVTIPPTTSTPQPNYFNTLEKIRTFVKSHQGKTINASNPIVFGQFKTMLQTHPTWKTQLESIEQIRVALGFNQATVIKIKPTWSSKFITVSWRKCHVSKKKNKPQSQSKPIATKSTMEVSSISNSELALFENTTQMNAGPQFSASVDPTADPTAVASKLTAAMRFAIRRQIFHWKKTHRLNRCCLYCRSLLWLHVDHVVPFTQLKTNFLTLCQTQHWTVPTDFDFHRKTCQPKFKKSNQLFSRRWQDYHQTHAQLQWLCRSCNLKKGKK